MSFIANALNNVPFTRVNQVIFESNGTYTPPDNLLFAKFIIQAGGGGSGGRAATTSTQRSIGGPGGGGGATIVYFSRADLLPDVTITVGLGGAAGSAGANPGGTGGASEIGSPPIVGAAGGAGGAASAAGTSVTASGGSGGGGGSTFSVLSIKGQTGNTAWYNNAGNISFTPGGNALLGFGGRWTLPGDLYGGGAGSIQNDGSAAAAAGVVGADGVIVIEEYLAEPV